MSDKDFKVKNKLVINGLSHDSGVLLSTNKSIDSHTNVPTQFGGTGTTTSPNSGQLLYSASGATYTPTDLSSLPGIYSIGNTASRPVSPIDGQIYSNTQTGFMEIYYSTYGWEQVGGIASTVTSVVATDSPSGRAFNNGRASISFTPGTILGRTYVVTSSPGSYTASGTASPIVITGLQSSTQYTYTVVASNNYGTASASSASSAVTATTVPQAPTGVSAVAGENQAIVSFTAGATGGAAISSYTVTSSPGSITATGSVSPITVTGLTNDTAYTFTVTATNANGTSLESTASSAVTPATSLVGSYDSLATVTVPSGGLASITFAGIPAGYRDLQIRAFVRNTLTNNYTANFYMRFNGDTGTNYSNHAIYGTGTSAVANIPTGANPSFAIWGVTGSAQFGVNIFDILDYASTTKNKTTRTLIGTDINGNGIVGLESGAWLNTSAINSIFFSIGDGTQTIAQYSSFSLYGVR